MCVDINVINVNKNLVSYASSNEDSLYCTVGYITICENRPAAVQAELVRCHKAGLMMIDTHLSIVEHRYSMNAKSLMGVVHTKPFYVYDATGWPS